MPSHGLQLLDAVVLDDHVGEQLAAHLVEVLVAGAVGDVEFDQAPDADVGDAIEPQPFEGMVDRTALRIEHAWLEADMDADLHLRAFREGRRLARSLWRSGALWARPAVLVRRYSSSRGSTRISSRSSGCR